MARSDPEVSAGAEVAVAEVDAGDKTKYDPYEKDLFLSGVFSLSFYG